MRRALTEGVDSGDPWIELDTYLADLEARNGAKHVATTGQQLKALRAKCPTLSIREVYAWRAEALRDGLSRATVNHYVGRAQTYLRWRAATGEHLPHPLTKKKHLLAVSESDLARRPRAFRKAEFAQFLAAVAEVDEMPSWDGGGGEPQVWAWRLLAETGLRWAEAAACRREDLDGDVVRVRAETSKNGDGRKTGPLSPEVAAWFARRAAKSPLLVARRGGSWRDATYSVARRVFIGAMDRAGLSTVDDDGRSLSIHSLRRTAATEWLRAGVPIAAVSRLLGHASTAFTESVYVDLLADDPVEIARAVLRGGKKND